MPGIHYKTETIKDAARKVAEEFPIEGKQRFTIPQPGVVFWPKRGRWERARPWRSYGCGAPQEVRS